jgi:hypothetical protein
MIRTQISLNGQDYRMLKIEAAAQGISVAEYVRRAIRRALPPPAEPAWMRYAGMVESGDSLSSQRIDEIIYGHKD